MKLKKKKLNSLFLLYIRISRNQDEAIMSCQTPTANGDMHVGKMALDVNVAHFPSPPFKVQTPRCP